MQNVHIDAIDLGSIADIAERHTACVAEMATFLGSHADAANTALRQAATHNEIRDILELYGIGGYGVHVILCKYASGTYDAPEPDNTTEDNHTCLYLTHKVA